MKKILLYSGGTDSWLIDKIWRPDIKLYVNTHGMYAKEEIEMLPSDVKIFDFPFLGDIEEHDTAYVPMRNLYFLMIASNFGDPEGAHLCYGATGADAGSHDKDRKFIDMTQELFDYMLIGNSFTKDRNVIIEKQFINDGKYSLVKKYLDLGGDIVRFVEQTFTCHHPVNGKPCMSCKLCAKKFLLGYYYGYRYDNTTIEKMLEYMRNKMLPRGVEKGTYFSERPLDGVYALKAVKQLFEDKGLKYEY